ncbi:MAG TPA: ABC transporter ATP-binding protein [Sediminispirochaeta sp.]|nr:ABC transporter ATP-binding protein [Sediminispirochaeta sp.]
MDTLLKTKDLTINFGGLLAVNKVNCEMNNEVLGLIGPNGSGKTTFLNLISGIYNATDGEIEFQGRNITKLQASDIRSIGIARTFQTNRLCLKLTVLDNMLLGLFSKQQIRWWETIFNQKKHHLELRVNIDKCLHVLSYFNEELVEQKYELIDTIPLIDRRRIEIARALVSDPALLLLDEPTAGLNPQETHSIVEDLKKIREKTGISMIFIEHDMGVISTIADRVVVLNAGQIIAEGSFAEVSKNEEVRSAYLGS